MAQNAHKGYCHIAHEAVEVPIQKRTVEYQRVDRRLRVQGKIVRRNKSAGAVSHQYYTIVLTSVASYHCQGRVDVRKIFLEAAGLEFALSGQYGASVLTQVEGIEVVARVGEAVALLGLEEVVVVAVYVKHACPGLVAGCEFAYYSAALRASIVGRLFDVLHLVALAENSVGLPLRHGLQNPDREQYSEY